ncbi:hypothetical protein QFC21_001006 [Naganishia friedmannii]|uniref:Uncharacterized protein n=1 Tax=Naganishia friedmannii TaxID=89922 RepID=A0ACC2W8Y7_9TREE|nr:hypothetical protein QFC21_001006 [Naganishia friedmannii]
MPSVAPSSPSVRAGSPPLSPSLPGKLQPGSYGIRDVVIGVHLFIRKPGPTGETEERWAEVLSIRDKPQSIYAPAPKPGQVTEPLDQVEYYVHYSEFNKRLDEWVGGSRLVLERELELPKPVQQEKPAKKKVTGAAAAAQQASRQDSPSSSLLRKAAMKSLKSPAVSGRMGKKNVARKAPQKSTPSNLSDLAAEDEDEDMDAIGEDDDEDEEDKDIVMNGEKAKIVTVTDGDADVAAPSNPLAVETLSKDDEIKRLRTTGSMTQQHSEISRVRNFKMIHMGKHEIETWYFSPYPIEFAHIDILYICEWCLSYFPSPMMLKRHLTKCTLHHPPGNEIYRDDNVSFFEIDGRKQRTWCRNLSLLSKCFLDHKFLYYDVDPFLFYCMAKRDENGCHLVGYFSKEKQSADHYNVACILTLPQFQRQSYGKLLIEFSYELSKVERVQGSPEKPLSDLGLLSYRAYWQEVIVDLLLTTEEHELSIDQMANITSIVPADISHTCHALHMIKVYKGNYIICLTDAVLEQHQRTKAKKRKTIDPSKLVWKPPTFSKAQLSFGF